MTSLPPYQHQNRFRPFRNRLLAKWMMTLGIVGALQGCHSANAEDPSMSVDLANFSTVGAPPATWEKPSTKELKSKLSPLQFKVTQKDGTEPPFKNEYWDNKEPGIYVDVISGEPLFASIHKYDSGTGWPSFWQPLIADNMVYETDNKLWMKRTEVRSKHADSHLGHVFDDGPDPTGKRYCINSAALRFIPAYKLDAEGYGKFSALFEESEGKKTAANNQSGS